MTKLLHDWFLALLFSAPIAALVVTAAYWVMD